MKTIKKMKEVCLQAPQARSIHERQHLVLDTYGAFCFPCIRPIVLDQ
jgi:hypothetical protein